MMCLKPHDSGPVSGLRNLGPASAVMLAEVGIHTVGELRAIGATTLGEYQKYIEKDKALERRFQKVLVEEPSAEDAISILRGLKERYETHHKVRMSCQCPRSAAFPTDAACS